MPRPLSKSTENLVQDLFIEIRKEEEKSFKVKHLNDAIDYTERYTTDSEDDIEQSDEYLRRGKTYLLSVSTENLLDLQDSGKTDDTARCDVNRNFANRSFANRSFKRIERSFDDEEINGDAFDQGMDEGDVFEEDKGVKRKRNDEEIEDDYLIVDFMDGGEERHISGITTLVFYHRGIPKPVISTENIRVRGRKRMLSSSVETTGFSTHGTTMVVFPVRCPRMYLHMTDQWYYSCPCFLHFSAEYLTAETLRRRAQLLGKRTEIQRDPEDKMVIHVMRDDSRENLLDLDYSGDGGVHNGSDEPYIGYQITFYDDDERQEISKLNLSSECTLSYEDRASKLKEIAVEIDIDHGNDCQANHELLDQEEPTLWPVKGERLSTTPKQDIDKIDIGEGQKVEHYKSAQINGGIKITDDDELNKNEIEGKGGFLGFFRRAKQRFSLTAGK